MLGRRDKNISLKICLHLWEMAIYSIKKAVLKSFAILTRKHMYRSLFLI